MSRIEIHRPAVLQFADKGASGGGQRLTRKQQKVQARAQRRASQAQADQWAQQRRTLLKIGIPTVVLVAGGGAVAATGVGRNILQLLGSSEPEREQEFSGEAEDTRKKIQALQQEVSEGKKTFKEQIPHITDLSVAYFVSEMQKMFPERKDQYNRVTIKNKIRFFDNKGYIDDKKGCGQNNSGVDPMSSPPHKEYMRVNQDYYLERKGLEIVQIMVHDFLHEFHHLVSPLKERAIGTRVLGVSEPITHEKGLTAFVLKPGDQCGGTFSRGSIEEPVVEDSALRLSEKIGFIPIRIEDKAYADSVAIYRARFINPSSDQGGFGGDHRELLGYQQSTDPDLFFSAIGRRNYPAVVDKQELIRLGTALVIRTMPVVEYSLK